jgi:hypothetical protein
VAATEALAQPGARPCAGWRGLARLLGGVVATGAAQGATLPEDQAEVLYHVYDGGGVKAQGPALLVRKSLADRVSLSAQYYVDAVSNASIDVVTTASPFKETRKAWDFSAQTVVRDGTLTLGGSRSTEPDYTATAFSLDSSQEVFGNMTTVNLGFTRGQDQVGRKGQAGWIDEATHWQYRAGLTQVLSPRWLASANFELISDSGFLGSPYRAARVFGAAVPERNPAHAHQPRAQAAQPARHPRAVGGQFHARRVPLLLGHLGHQGAHPGVRLVQVRGRTLAGGRLAAQLQPGRRCSTATTPPARRCTCRATGSSARFAAPRWRCAAATPGRA